MRNLKAYTEDAFLFHKNVVKRKQNPKADLGYKARLDSYNSKVENQFKLYDNGFNDKILENLIALSLTAQEKSDILALYSYKAKAIQNLKIKLTTTETNRIISTCQNCTIGEVSSMDHILPKETFAEFVVHPKNLFPSCSKCNSFKVNSWLEDGRRVFLNLFIDELPPEQYLFVNAVVTTDNIQTFFQVENRNGIPQELFRLIQSHYGKLYLCQRFSESASEVITALDNSIVPYVGKLPPHEIISAVKEKILRDKSVFGPNYWKSVLELSLIDNKDYLDRLFLRS